MKACLIGNALLSIYEAEYGREVITFVPFKEYKYKFIKKNDNPYWMDDMRKMLVKMLQYHLLGEMFL